MPGEPEERSASARPATCGFRTMVRFSDILGRSELGSVEPREGRLGSACAEPSLAAKEHREHRVDRPAGRRDLPKCCPDPAVSTGTRRHPLPAAATTNPAASLKFQRKGAPRLHPHPTPRHGSRSRASRATGLGALGIDASEPSLDGPSSGVVAVLHVGHRPPHAEGLLTHRADDPIMIGARSVPILRHERQRAQRQPSIRVRLGEPLDRFAR